MSEYCVNCESTQSQLAAVKAELAETKKEYAELERMAEKLALDMRYVRDNACGIENKSFIDATLSIFTALQSKLNVPGKEPPCEK